MENQFLNPHFDVINDLEKLANSELLPVIQRLKFEINQSSRRDSTRSGEFLQEQRRTLGELSDYFCRQLILKTKISQIAIQTDPQLDGDSWFSWLGDFENLFGLFSQFELGGSSRLTIDNHQLVLRTEKIELVSQTKTIESQILKQSKDLLRRGVIVTSRLVTKVNGRRFFEFVVSRNEKEKYFLHVLDNSFLFMARSRCTIRD